MGARKMQREDFEAAADFMFANVERAIKEGLEVTPMIFGLQMRADHTVAAHCAFEAAPFFLEGQGLVGKEMAAAALLHVAKNEQADIAVLVTRAWILVTDKLPTPAEVQDPDLIANNPDAKDGYVLFLRTADFATVAQALYDEQARTLDRQPMQWGPGGYQGRFSHRRGGESMN